MKIWLHIFITALVLFTIQTANGQFRKGQQKVISSDVFQGFIFRHKEQINHLIIDHPVGFRLTYEARTFGDESWQQRYNFPDVGLTFIYMNYKNPVLGKSLALIPYYDFYIRKNREAKGQFKYKVGLGLGYNTEKYDRVENNKNSVISTDFSFGILAELSYSHKINKRLDFNSYVALTHFSNGSIKKPNSGINVISLNLGLSYLLSQRDEEFKIKEEEKIEHSNFGGTLSLSGGAHESTKIGAGTFPFFIISGFIDKKLNRKSIIGLGVEMFYSEALRRDIKYDFAFEDRTKPDFKRIGIAFGHELIITKFTVISQVGYYVYDPYKPFGKVYIRAGLRRYFNDHIFTSLAVKSHGARAETAEFTLGYRIK